MTVPLLKVTAASKRFGGLVALDAVDLEIASGQIYGLIGPNGAGKTTFFNVVTGLYRPDGGTFALGGQPYEPSAVHEVARAGIVRTFQNIRLFGDMSAAENVMVGCHATTHTGLFSTMLATRRAHEEERAVHEIAINLLHYVGIAHLGKQSANTLSYGDQRRVEIARALAARPRLLALDEPAAGMNSAEKRQLGELLQRIRASGTTLLLIEHDVKLVMGLCDAVSVLDGGKLLAAGSPADVRRNPDVIRAYLGTGAGDHEDDA